MKEVQGGHGGNRVLVLMATFNGAQWIDEQVASIVGQAGVRLAWTFADDGSTDSTPERLEHFVATLPRVGVLAPEKGQLGAAGNFLRLLREAPLDEIDFVALADQDDLWQPGRLARALGELRRHQADGYSSDAVAFWPDGRRRVLGKAGAQREFDYLFEPAGPGCTYVLNVTLARTLQQELRSGPQRFEGIGYHDWLIYAFARTHGFRWTIDTEPGVLYRQHGQNELGANFGLDAVQRRWGRLRTGWFRQQILQIASLWPGEHGVVAEHLRRFGWRDRLWLGCATPRCRRRLRDQIALAAMLLLGILR